MTDVRAELRRLAVEFYSTPEIAAVHAQQYALQALNDLPDDAPSLNVPLLAFERTWYRETLLEAGKRLAAIVAHLEVLERRAAEKREAA